MRRARKRRTSSKTPQRIFLGNLSPRPGRFRFAETSSRSGEGGAGRHGFPGSLGFCVRRSDGVAVGVALDPRRKVRPHSRDSPPGAPGPGGRSGLLFPKPRRDGSRQMLGAETQGWTGTVVYPGGTLSGGPCDRNRDPWFCTPETDPSSLAVPCIGSRFPRSSRKIPPSSSRSAGVSHGPFGRMGFGENPRRTPKGSCHPTRPVRLPVPTRPI